MKKKVTWKPVGHSAKKWREMAGRRGSVLPPMFPPQRKNAARHKAEVK